MMVITLGRIQNIKLLMATYKTRDKQSVYDLAVQLYGDVSKIGKLLTQFTDLDNVLTLNSEIEVATQTDPIAIYFIDKSMIVSTDFTPVVSSGDRVLREDGFFLLREDGSYILRES